MANCRDVQGFLTQLSAHAVTSPLPDADLQHLADLKLIGLLSTEQYQALQAQVGAIGQTQAALSQESAERAQLAGELGKEFSRDHSVLFHLHGKDAQAADLDQEAKTRAQFQAVDADLVQREQAFNALLGQRTMLDTLVPFSGRYVGITAPGLVAMRDLTVRLYRYGDVDFDTYLAQAQRIDQELVSLATGGASYYQGLAAGIPGADRSYLWAVGIGLTKAQPDANAGVPRFLEAYRATGDLSSNSENRLMASEILLALPQSSAAEKMGPLGQLVKEVRGIGVPRESALGVAAIVLFGRRADGTFATANVQQFLQVTRSYESAALLGIDNDPPDALLGKFRALRSMFAGWGFDYSEDTELSSAYLAVSENEPDQISSKLAILSRGLSAYLQYPLVAAAILGSITTLEANEALSLVEKAYGIVGPRAAGLSQTELICLAVRMVHGIRNELVGNLDTTATQAPSTGRPSGFYGYGPHPVFLPVIIAHGAYYSTFGGISGVHPGHVHGMPGFGGGG